MTTVPIPLEVPVDSLLETNASAEAKAKKGYFRLSGQVIDPATSSFEPIDVVVSDIPVTLGRREAQTGHVNIGKYSSLSREHGRILWDESKSQFYVEIFSKNTSVVDGVPYEKGSRAPLKSKSAIKFSNSHIYFLLPAGKRAKKESSKVEKDIGVKESPPVVVRVPYAKYTELVGAAFEELSPNNEPLSAREVVTHLMNSHPEWTDRLTSVTAAIKKVLKRKYSETPNLDVRNTKYVRGLPIAAEETERIIDLSTTDIFRGNDDAAIDNEQEEDVRG